MKIGINISHAVGYDGGSVIVRRSIEAIKRYSTKIEVLEYGGGDDYLKNQYNKIKPPKVDKLLNLIPPAHMLTRIPQYSYIHDLPLECETNTLKEKIYNKVFIPLTILKSGTILVCSEYVKSTMDERCPRYNSKVKILPYPLDTTIYGQPISRYGMAQYLSYHGIKDNFILSVITSSRWRKGADMVTGIYKALPKAIRDDFDYIVVGGCERPSHIPTGMHYLGNVGDTFLRDLYTKAQLVIVPSRYEGFGLAALEAAASGTDCVCTDLPSLREAASPAASFAIDINTFSIKIVKLLGDNLGKSIRKQAHQEHANKFSYKVFVDNLEKIIL